MITTINQSVNREVDTVEKLQRVSQSEKLFSDK